MRAKLTTLDDLYKAKRVQVKPYQRKGKFVAGYSRLDPRIGERVRVSEGSGIDSGKTGVIVSPGEVKTRGDLVPTNIEGAYKPVDWKREVAVRLDNGELITMFKNRLIPEPQFKFIDVGYSQPMKYEKVHTGVEGVVKYEPVGFEKPSKQIGKPKKEEIYDESDFKVTVEVEHKDFPEGAREIAVVDYHIFHDPGGPGFPSETIAEDVVFAWADEPNKGKELTDEEYEKYIETNKYQGFYGKYRGYKATSYFDVFEGRILQREKDIGEEMRWESKCGNRY